MSTTARRRLISDFKRFEKEETNGLFASPQEYNIMCWEAVIFGPEDTPWEGGSFKLILEFTEEYPNKPPNIKFITSIFHPNGKYINNNSIRRWKNLFRYSNKSMDTYI